MTAIFRVEKHPWAEKRVKLDWRPYLGTSGVTVQTSEWLEASDAVTFSDAALIENQASVVVSGGADGATAYVENRVTFSDGSRDVRTVIMPIASKAPAA